MFLNTEQFPFVKHLEDNWQLIREEYLALPATSFQPWVQRDMYGEGWTVYGLIAFGERIEPALQTCPRTAELLADVLGLTTAGFSRLSPGAHIAPHVGWVSTVYRAHLGLVVPTGCAIRVGGETRCWRDGESLVFDDTVEHEAWNHSSLSRTVLLFDFRRPEVPETVNETPPPEVRAFVRALQRP